MKVDVRVAELYMIYLCNSGLSYNRANVFANYTKYINFLTNSTMSWGNDVPLKSLVDG